MFIPIRPNHTTDKTNRTKTKTKHSYIETMNKEIFTEKRHNYFFLRFNDFKPNGTNTSPPIHDKVIGIAILSFRINGNL